jgi:hypothetical protein
MTVVCRAQNLGQFESDLTERVLQLHVNQGTLLEALSKLSVKSRVPIGFVPKLGHKHDYNLTINLDSATLKTVLDTIIQKQPDYRWEVKDGVINILPTKSVDDFVENFLNTRINRFVPPKLATPSRLRDAVTEIPEVQGLLKASGISAARYGYFSRYPSLYTDPNVDLNISGTDVRGVLNKIIRESEHKMWIVSREGKNLESLVLGF